MPNLETIEWGEQTFEIQTDLKQRRTFEASEHPYRKHTLPTTATVTCRASVDGWGGQPGITYFIEQSPAVLAQGTIGVTLISTPEPYRARNKALFGRMASINLETGAFYPPQLPKVLQYVSANWGWTIDEQVSNLLRQVTPTKQ